MIHHLADIKSFDDFCAKTESLKAGDKGFLFELFTYYMFKLDPRLNNGLQNLWLYRDISVDLLEELNLPSRDKGIDLLAKINDQYYPIQCKFRQDPSDVITWTELSTFYGMAFGMNDTVRRGFLVTNTYDLCQDVMNSIKVEPIYGDFFDGLDEDFFHNLHNAIASERNMVFNPKPMRDYQRKCDIASCLHFMNHDRGYIEMACGTGKTMMSYWIDRYMHNFRTVIFVPSIYLLSQCYSEWARQSHAEQLDVKYLLIGSDADIDSDVKYKSNGLILETKPKIIRAYLKKVKRSEKLVVICTYQSSDKLAKACGQRKVFDLGIFDEAHKTTGSADKKFSLMLDDTLMTIRKRLFMTATPRMYGGRIDTDEVVSMDNEEIYGKRIYAYNTGTAIKEKRLVDYQVITMYARDKEIAKTIKEHKLVKYRDQLENLDASYLGTILLLLKKIHDGTCSHLVTYHNKVRSAKIFSQMLRKVNELLYGTEIFVGHLNGSMSMSKRNRIIRDFVKAPIGVLCSARVLNEGVNIPSIDSVCFVDPRFSTIDLVQCIGRSLRMYDGKRIASVIVPIFIKDFDTEFLTDVWGNVIRILKAMKTTDDGIVEYFMMKDHGQVVGGRNLVVTEFYGVTVEEFGKNIDLEAWKEGIMDQVWRVVDSWKYNYNRFTKWVEENEKIPSDKSKNILEKQLGTFCSESRRLYKNNKLDSSKIELFEKINLWYWAVHPIDRWKNIIHDVEKYMDKFKERPKNNSKDPKIKQLARWLTSQNRKYNNSTGILENIHIRHLWELFVDKYGIYFMNIPKWNYNFMQAETYIEKHKKCPSGSSTNTSIRKLAIWISHQNENYRTGNYIMENPCIRHKWKSFIEKHTDIFCIQNKWLQTLSEVVEYIDTCHKRPPCRHADIKIKKLSYWLSIQLKYYRLGKGSMKNPVIRDHMTKFLSKYQSYVETRFEKWETMLKKVITYISENNTRPSSKDKDMEIRRIGQWLEHQHVNYRNKQYILKDQIFRKKWAHFLKTYGHVHNTKIND